MTEDGPLDDPDELMAEESKARVLEARPATGRTTPANAQKARLGELKRDGHPVRLGPVGLTVWRLDWFGW